jgi:fused signal recognition particle receptor
VIFKVSFDRLKHSLSKTKAGLVEKIVNLVGQHRQIDQELLTELEEILIQADVGVATSEKILTGLKAKVAKEKIQDSERVVKLLQEEMREIVAKGSQRFHSAQGNKLQVILIVGVNGTGKTTSIGKLAYQYKQAGKKVLIAAADTFRAAAIDQLAIWAKRAEAEFVRSQPEADPAAVAYDAVKSALARNLEVVIIDTAGRLHTKVNLMEELKKIKRVVAKVDPSFPQEILLVLDATTGQNALSQVKLFQEAVQPTGLILTKLDGTAKGGVIIAIADQLKVPVRYIGIGEGIEDWEEFQPQQFVEALFE